MCYLDTGLKNECCGCSVCVQICPRNAIRMSEDQEGFFYPSIDHAICIQCNLCRKKCMQIKEPFFREPRCVKAGFVESEEILLKSASGGAFYAILNVAEPDAIVFGAKWIDRSHVVHTDALASEAYIQFRKSKYVQSVIGNSYKKVKENLDNGKQVFFFGTPCQVQGLKMYLSEDYDKLLCVDLICHGVASSNFLELALRELDTKGNKIKCVEFRHKEKRQGKWNSKLTRINFESGKKDVLDYDHFSFLRAYDNGLIFRPSCCNCAFARRERISDLTIGDFWGGEESGLNPHYGASLIMANTQKGVRILTRLDEQMTLKVIDYDYAVNHNGRLRRPDKGNDNLQIFREMIKNTPFSKAVNRFAPPVPAWKKFARRVLKK